MILALVARNVRHHRGLFAALAVGFVAFSSLMIHIAVAIEAGPGLAEILRLLPPGLRRFLDAQFNLQLASFSAFVAFVFQHPGIVIGVCAYAIVVGTIPAAERDAGLLELLLARPLPRGAYLTSTLLTLLLGVVALPACLLVGVLIGLMTVDAPEDLPWTRFLPSAAGLGTLVLAVGGAALAASTVARRRGPAAVWLSAVLVALFVIEGLAELWPPLRHVRWMSPFHYFRPVVSVATGATPIRDPLVLLGTFTVTTAFAYARFARRDL